MSWINRTMIVPAEHVDLARALAEGISGPAGAGMWTTGLSADGAEPATHFISAGQVDDELVALMPLTVYTTDADGKETSITTPGQPDVIAAHAGMPVELITAMLNEMTVTDEDPFVSMARLGVRMVQEAV